MKFQIDSISSNDDDDEEIECVCVFFIHHINVIHHRKVKHVLN